MNVVARLLNIPGLSRARWVFFKEISSFMGSIQAPVSIGIIVLWTGLISGWLSSRSGATYESVTKVLFWVFYIELMFVGIFMAIPSFVNEKRQGTMELLYTLPISDIEITLGKFLTGAFFLSCVSVIITLVYAVGIAEAPWYVAITGIFGMILVGMYFYSVGLFASSVSDNWIVAAFIAFSVVLVQEVGGFYAGLLPKPASEILTHLQGFSHFSNFTTGIISLKDTVFYLTLTVFFLFLTVKVLESRRWRG